MRVLDPGRIGRVSMKPPLDRRYIEVMRYDSLRTVRRHITSVDPDDYSVRRPCAWCERGGTGRKTYRYRPLSYGFSWHVDSQFTPEHNPTKNDINCCCWACFDQWLNYHLQVVDEIEFSLLMGVIPEYVPTWYMPREVLESMIVAARWLAENPPYRCSETERWVPPRSLRKRVRR